MYACIIADILEKFADTKVSIPSSLIVRTHTPCVTDRLLLWRTLPTEPAVLTISLPRRSVQSYLSIMAIAVWFLSMSQLSRYGGGRDLSTLHWVVHERKKCINEICHALVVQHELYIYIYVYVSHVY